MSLQTRLTELAQATGAALKLRGLPPGGTVGNVLRKTGPGDFEAGWQAGPEGSAQPQFFTPWSF
ncbi:MAG: hypothetical protein MUF14_05675 [Hyphomonadaceae bacterium]|jgi:hypothetical protein|nr:hypothetical protein [Hyphomonadaceae bacterium]